MLLIAEKKLIPDENVGDFFCHSQKYFMPVFFHSFFV